VLVEAIDRFRAAKAGEYCFLLPNLSRKAKMDRAGKEFFLRGPAA
jgi:hypothetical protein